MAQFNYDDPRYQREIQKAAAKKSMGPGLLSRVTTGEIAGRHAKSQLERQEQLRGLALRSKLSEQYASQFDRTHSLNVDKQKFSDKNFKRNLSQEKTGINQTMLMGLLGAGYSTYEGQRRKKLMEETLATQRYQNSVFEDFMFRQLSPYGSRLTQEEQ